MERIRTAVADDVVRLAEIEIFNYRLNFYPIFRNDDFYFSELQVPALAAQYREKPELLAQTLVYDDGVVKGFLRLEGSEVRKLFVEPVLQGKGIGSVLLRHAAAFGADRLWALEKNTRAITFYARHGFFPAGEKKKEEDTEEYLILLKCGKPIQ
ncbi:MAG: GNAT family N-acetyltransferase [Clostridiales bacterium]|nr:GNAT family N-acetyltransferase [Clostridiales bacterium]